MINEEVILSPMGDTQYHEDNMTHMGGYHEYHGGKSFLLFEYPTVVNPPWYS